ncbi:aspartate/glutamate racemase family protein [Tenuibacillus multivorans]|uniref:Aspartate racemase n=1 Tax=Tenuibacillus multivorans TaxID=237069 RepID=A0A1G9WCF2_9BACI|nr:amino acid racemase [Tenuibacillus multivorans]GEL76389.1 aspartate racemase [Tenuibacillus multivorans]SDM81881.1 aspartate racemase [Tenuibacillus multivorans]
MQPISLGVIGGMGPKATSVFYDKVIDQTEAHKDQDHINMVILNHATMPDRTEAILTNQSERFLQSIEQDFKLLEHAGVANIAIPCNTSHFYYKQLQAMTNIPIINMVEETIRYIHDRCGAQTRVGILATNGTMKTGIYKAACEKYRIELYEPHEALQDEVMKLIYEDVKSELATDPRKLENMVQHLITQENCQSVILACTELSCIPIRGEFKKYTIDAMNVLVEQSILRSGKSLRYQSVTEQMVSSSGQA